MASQLGPGPCQIGMFNMMPGMRFSTLLLKYTLDVHVACVLGLAQTSSLILCSKHDSLRTPVPCRNAFALQGRAVSDSCLAKADGSSGRELQHV